VLDSADIIGVAITNGFAPAGSLYHVTWTTFQPNGITSNDAVDLIAWGVGGGASLDIIGNDEYMTIRIWSPSVGIAWGFYEISIIQSSSGPNPIVACSVTVS
jgi:hypothetical protein